MVILIVYNIYTKNDNKICEKFKIRGFHILIVFQNINSYVTKMI